MHWVCAGDVNFWGDIKKQREVEVIIKLYLSKPALTYVSNRIDETLCMNMETRLMTKYLIITFDFSNDPNAEKSLPASARKIQYQGKTYFIINKNEYLGLTGNHIARYLVSNPVPENNF